MPKDPWDDWDNEEGAATPSDEMPEEGGMRPDFLKPMHLGKAQKGFLKLIGVSEETSEYSDVILRVEFMGKEFAIGLKLFSPDYSALKAHFGKKKADWHGQLAYKVVKYKDTSYVSVRPTRSPRVM
jgi:hypothetical protein